MKITVSERPGTDETRVDIICGRRDEAIERLIEAIKLEDGRLYGRTEDGGVTVINPSDVYYAESVDGRCFIYLEKESYQSAERLIELEKLLTGRVFVRVSKSMVVNLSKLRTLEPDEGRRMRITMKNNEMITVSRQYAPALKRLLGI